MHLDLFVCLSVQQRNSKTIVPIDLILLHKKDYPHSSVLFSDDPDRDPDLYSRMY